MCGSAVLARWLVLYMLGDPETAEAELASELAGIYRDALPSAKGALSVLWKGCCRVASSRPQLSLAAMMRGNPVQKYSLGGACIWLCCHAVILAGKARMRLSGTVSTGCQRLSSDLACKLSEHLCIPGSGSDVMCGADREEGRGRGCSAVDGSPGGCGSQPACKGFWSAAVCALAGRCGGPVQALRQPAHLHRCKGQSCQFHVTGCAPSLPVIASLWQPFDTT